jgi:hypothetical protein
MIFWGVEPTMPASSPFELDQRAEAGTLTAYGRAPRW